jgi:molybdopterin-guanine dinucleotide biosynthesis protein A
MSDRTGAAAIVVAGGKSTRFGRDKASELLLGLPMLQRVLDRLAGRVDEYVVVKRQGQELPGVAAVSLRIVEDVYPDTGPLGGICTGLETMEAPLAIAVACDMPLLQPALIEALLALGQEHDLVVPMRGGMPEPLCAVYSKACIGPMQRQLDSGNLKVTGFYGLMTPWFVREEEWRRFDPQGLSFENLNREKDLQRAIDLLEAEAMGSRQ